MRTFGEGGGMKTGYGRLQIVVGTASALSLAIALSLALPVGAAAEGTAGATITKRDAVVQIVKCMRKRMAADRMLSYNQAAKDCKQFVLNSSSGSGPLVVSQSSGAPK